MLSWGERFALPAYRGLLHGLRHALLAPRHAFAFLPGMWVPLYLMCISWSPVSVGAYFTVTVPSLLSTISGWAVLPDGMWTSPGYEKQSSILTSCYIIRYTVQIRLQHGHVITVTRTETIIRSAGTELVPHLWFLLCLRWRESPCQKAGSRRRSYCSPERRRHLWPACGEKKNTYN